MTDLRQQYEASEYAQQKRQIRRSRLDRFLALRREREQHDAVPKSKRRWDPSRCRWVDEQECHD